MVIIPGLAVSFGELNQVALACAIGEDRGVALRRLSVGDVAGLGSGFSLPPDADRTD